MFIPKPFNQDNFAQIKQLMAEFPLTTITASIDEAIHACHIPLFWEDDGSEYGILIGHAFKGNPILKTSQSWLVIFQDTGCYISPNWYPNKAKTHKEVPTWNYRAVHCSVEPFLTTELNELKYMVGKLSNIHENSMPTPPEPWSLDDAPDEFIDKLCKAIVGFRLKIIDVQAQFKLSQNKDEATRTSIVDNLNNLDNPLANRMAEHVALTKK